MDKPPLVHRLKRGITLDDLTKELLSQEANENLSQMHFQEAKTWSMRWAVLGIVVGWILLSTLASTILFLVTRSDLAFAPLTIAMGVTPSLIKTISRFLFWGENDYRLEMLRLTLKARERELKYSRKLPSHQSHRDED